MPLNSGRQRQLVLDAVEAGPDHRRVGQVGVHVAAREAILDVERRPAPDQPEAGRPVVATPDDVDRRPRQRRVALVRVDERGDEDRQLARQLHHPGHELLADLGQPVRPRRLAVGGVHQRHRPGLRPTGSCGGARTSPSSGGRAWP